MPWIKTTPPAHARELLRAGDWGDNDATLRLHADVAPVNGNIEGDRTRVTVLLEPPEPECPEGGAHSWDSGESYGSDHGQVRVTWTCQACALRCVIDHGATCRDCGECYTRLSYEHPVRKEDL